ncbi:hypothetical protein [Stenotrophomonas forensis]|uniref:hypothetical protein n=1 Tax=Stenotrophomonas forensis TaxID=2871169 RepID=UPI0036D67C58
MGTLVVRHYPTKLFLKAADHTYVECGTGARGWKCWGGKTGGKFLRSVTGSTLRADSVATPNETAGITCYLINGVCHQAANRILSQSNITVDGARGYSLSVSLFGVLGRERGFLGRCKAPFVDFPGVTGDLSACIGDTVLHTGDDVRVSFNPGRRDYEDVRYMSEVRELYQRVNAGALQDTTALFENQMQHFRLFLNHKFGYPQDRVSSAEYHRIMVARENFESRRIRAEEAFAETRDGLAFVRKFDEMTLEFQDEVAQAVDGQAYFTLLNLSPDERIVLSDPEGTFEAYGDGTEPGGAAT